MLWTRGRRDGGRPGAAGRSIAAPWVEPVYMMPLYALAIGGLFCRRRRLAVLVALLLAYETLVAIGLRRRRRATGCRGTSCSRSPRRRSAARTWLTAGARAGRAMRVVHVHRIRGIGGSERHLLTLLPALRRARRRRVLRRPRRSRLACSTRTIAELETGERTSGSRAPRDLDPGSHAAARAAGRLVRGPTWSTRTSCTPTSTGRAAPRHGGRVV